MLHVRSHTHLPVALVRGGSAAVPAVVPGSGLCGSHFILGEAHVSPHASDAGREAELRERLEQLAAAVDLREPFERIRAAIDEAQRH
jgi:hypothetical protein